MRPSVCIIGAGSIGSLFAGHLAQVADVCAALARACSAAAMVFAMHHIKLASLVTHGLDSDWHCGLMERVAREQLLIASSTSEAGIGGDLRNSLCAVEAVGEVFDLSKDATVISYGAQADLILATARRNPQHWLEQPKTRRIFGSGSGMARGRYQPLSPKPISATEACRPSTIRKSCASLRSARSRLSGGRR